MEKEDGIVLVDLNGLQELLGWLSHFILRWESLLEVSCQLLNVLRVHLHFITQSEVRRVSVIKGKFINDQYYFIVTETYRSWYSSLAISQSLCISLTRLPQWFARQSPCHSADMIVLLLLGLNFKGNGGSRVTVQQHYRARHQHSRLSIPYILTVFKTTIKLYLLTRTLCIKRFLIQ